MNIDTNFYQYLILISIGYYICITRIKYKNTIIFKKEVNKLENFKSINILKNTISLKDQK